MVYNIIDFGAKGDGKTDDSKAIQSAIDKCSISGGGRVFFPGGNVFLSGPFYLKSHVDLYVQTGATLLANPNEDIYSDSAFRENTGEGTIWIGGDKIEMVSISGGGIIDGNGIAFMGEELEHSFDLKPFEEVDPRPHMITLVGGKNIKIRDITLKNAAYWSLHLVGCNDVSISDITILNSLKIRNSDGIDLDHSKNVRISNCHIESGDDCICFKNRREYAEYGPCENITVMGCTLISTSCAIKIGSENMDRISSVAFINCIIKDSNRGIGIQHRDEGEVSDIVFSNIIIECRLFSDVWWGKAEPISITAFPRATDNHKDAGWRLPKGKRKGYVGEIKNITFSNIRCKSENGVAIIAETPDKVSNIRFNDVDLEINKTTDYPGGNYDCRPCEGEGMVTGKTYGFFLKNARNVFISNCFVNWGKNRPEYFSHALKSIDVDRLTIENFEGESAYPDKESAIHFSNPDTIFKKVSNKEVC